MLADLPTNGSNPTHLVIGGGKDGALYLLNRDNLGGAGDTNAWQMISAGGVYATGAFWNSNFYIGESQAALSDYVLSATTAKLSFVKTATAPVFGFPGATPSVSSMPDDSNGIIWALDQTNYCTEHAPGCGQVILHAYDATNIATELWNSSQGTGNAAGNAVKFTVPTVANGKVFVGTRGNNAAMWTAAHQHRANSMSTVYSRISHPRTWEVFDEWSYREDRTEDVRSQRRGCICTRSLPGA